MKCNTDRKHLTPRKRQQIFRKIFFGTALVVLGVVLTVLISGVQSKVNAADNYYKYYTDITVMPGDSLYEYSLEYGEHYSSSTKFIDEVCNINYIEADDIKAGMTLIIPYYSTELKY